MIELYIKIALILPFLAYASYTDIKYRIVKNKVWRVMLPLVIPFIIYDIATHNTTIYLVSFSFIVTAILMIPLTYLPEKYSIGGADAKLLILLSLLFQKQLITPLLSNISPPLFSISLFGNASILTAIWFFAQRIYRRSLNENYNIQETAPFMVAILIGFFVTMFVGDVLYWVAHPLYCMI